MMSMVALYCPLFGHASELLSPKQHQTTSDQPLLFVFVVVVVVCFVFVCFLGKSRLKNLVYVLLVFVWTRFHVDFAKP